VPYRPAVGVGSSWARSGGDSLSLITCPLGPLWPPLSSSPRTSTTPPPSPLSDQPSTGLIGSLIREEGRLYYATISSDLLYTGSDSKHSCVEEPHGVSGFNPGRGLMKVIVISGERIFTRHLDGKIHIWKFLSKDLTMYKVLPRLKDFLKSSIKPSNYVKVRRHATPSCCSISTSCPASALTRKRVSSTRARWTRLWKRGETQTPINSNRWVPTTTQVIQWSSDSIGLFSSCPWIVRSKCKGGSQ